MYRFGRSGSWLEKGMFASAAATLGWKDAVPLLEGMLADPNESLRVDAAEALVTLTGREVDARRSEPRFPAVRPVAGLVGEPLATWESRGIQSGGFVVDAAGEPRMCVGAGAQLRLHGSAGRLVETLDVPELEDGAEVRCQSALGLAPAGRDGRLVLGCTKGFLNPDFLVALDAGGELAWSYLPDWSGVDGLTLLHTAEGVQGVVADFGAHELVALDVDGDVLWRRGGFLPAYQLLSHPDLPGVLYVVYGRLERFAVSRTGYEHVAGPLQADLRYLTEAELFPGDDGRPSLVAAATDTNGAQELVRLDERGGVRWTATLPGRVGGLTMLEPPGSPRLFVVTVDTGRLLVLDEHGTLLHDAPLPGAAADGSQTTLDLDAGELAPGEWCLFLHVPGSCTLFPLDPSRL